MWLLCVLIELRDHRQKNKQSDRSNAKGIDADGRWLCFFVF